MQKKKKSKGKEKSEQTAKMVKIDTTRSVDKKLLSDALKTRKLTTTTRIRVKKGTIVHKEHIVVVEVGGREGDINVDVATTTEMMRKKVHKGRRTKSSKVKPTPPHPKENLLEEVSVSASKRRKLKKKDQVLLSEERNEILKYQKVFSGRVLNPRIFEQPRMVELVEYARH